MLKVRIEKLEEKRKNYLDRTRNETLYTLFNRVEELESEIAKKSEQNLLMAKRIDALELEVKEISKQKLLMAKRLQSVSLEKRKLQEEVKNQKVISKLETQNNNCLCPLSPIEEKCDRLITRLTQIVTN